MTMNVSEGLSCGFQQQAVAIDLENGADYVPLGPVRKTVVMTPDLKVAMKSTPDEAQS
jgi:thiamine monophosphate synthase